MLFTPEAVLWGTDIGIDHDSQTNYLIRWERSTQMLHKVVEIDGPAYYSAPAEGGTLAVGTAVEGGKNEKDKRVHLYLLKDHDLLENIPLWRRWPVIGRLATSLVTFPLSTDPLPRLLFNANFVKSRADGALFEVVF
jgi:hypothetical protein